MLERELPTNPVRGRRQQAVLLLVKQLMPFGQQVVHLTGRDVHPQFQQLLVQQRQRFVNGQIAGLGAFRGTGPRRPLRRTLGRLRQAFEPHDLVFKLPDPLPQLLVLPLQAFIRLLQAFIVPPQLPVGLLQFGDHAQQRLHQRSPLLRRDLNATNRLSPERPCHPQIKASSADPVKTNFHGVIEK
jgi:hypothetical protein